MPSRGTEAKDLWVPDSLMSSRRNDAGFANEQDLARWRGAALAPPLEEAEELRIKIIDEAGRPHLYQIERAVPMSRVFTEHAKLNKLRLENLRFTLNGLSLPVDCPFTGEQLKMDEENDTIHVRSVTIVTANNPITIRFVDEVGEKVDVDAWTDVHIYRLFHKYSDMQGLDLVWALLQFTYKGERLPSHCDETVSQLGMKDGHVIYVSCRMLCQEEFNDAFSSLLMSAGKATPLKFINQRVADDRLDAKDFGTVVGYSGHGDDTIWTAEYPNNITKQYTRGELIRCMQTYYCEKNGFERDILVYLEQQAERLHAEVGLLRQREDRADALVLHALKLEQKIEQLQLMVRESPLFHGIQQTFAEQALDLVELRRAMVTDRMKGRAHKPVLNAGDTVYAKWQPDSQYSWQRGMIEESSRCFYSDASGYGLRREYCVKFDNGDVKSGVAEDDVTHEAEYYTQRDLGQATWIGVERRVDSDSTDRWSSKTGWFVAKIDGVDQPFTYLTDALRAHDAHTVACKGFSTGEGELNMSSDGWRRVLEALKEQKVTESEIRWRQRMRVRLLLSRERVVRSSDMDMIGSSLFHLANRTPRDYKDEQLRYQLPRTYKDCERYFLDDNVTLMRQNLYRFALIRQCVEERMEFDQLCRFFIAAEGDIDRFLQSVPVFREGYDVAFAGKRLMMGYLEACAPRLRGDFWLVNIVDAGNSTKRKYVAQKNRPLKDVLAKYAQQRGTAVTSLRIELKGRPVFLSTIGKKSPTDLGLKDGEIVKVTVLQTAPPETAPTEELQRKPQRQKSKGKGKKKGAAKSKKKRPHNIELPVNDEERTKKQWLDAISRVFVEADPQFREIRQRLNALSLQRTGPKQRRRQPKEEAAAEPVDNPPSDGIGGKAGKSQFIVQVGEVANLYKTAKPSAARKQSSGQIARELDLHGCTVDEALAKLDECLTEWVDTAMKGEYPWVIPVRIVCGGGSQTLAEAVEGWIRQSPNVSNAPKNLYSQY
ncbi:hypothetical protein ACHAXT_011979 [Thalassiosira profunda]